MSPLAYNLPPPVPAAISKIHPPTKITSKMIGVKSKVKKRLPKSKNCKWCFFSVFNGVLELKAWIRPLDPIIAAIVDPSIDSRLPRCVCNEIYKF